MTGGGYIYVDTQYAVSRASEKHKYRLHWLRALLRFLLLALGRAEEAAEETRLLFLEVDFKVLVIIHLCASQLAAGFWVGCCRLICVQAFRHERHGLQGRSEQRK